MTLAGDEAGRPVDECLVLLSQSGSVDAMDRLARRWTPRLVRYAARVLGGSNDSAEAARDVAQDTWLAAIKSLDQLREPGSFPAWIYGIATRKCVDVIRARARRRRLDHEVSRTDAEGATASRMPEQSIDLSTAIRRLPTLHRAVVHLFYREELSVTAIAAVLRVPVGTVKSRLHHAREELRCHLEGRAGVGHL